MTCYWEVGGAGVGCVVDADDQGRGVLRVTCCVGRGACSGGGSVVRVACDVLLGGWWCRSGYG